MEYCVCGHRKEFHGETGKICSPCLAQSFDAMFHEFKLGNLKLIEDLAEERKLV